MEVIITLDRVDAHIFLHFVNFSPLISQAIVSKGFDFVQIMLRFEPSHTLEIRPTEEFPQRAIVITRGILVFYLL